MTDEGHMDASSADDLLRAETEIFEVGDLRTPVDVTIANAEEFIHLDLPLPGNHYAGYMSLVRKGHQNVQGKWIAETGLTFAVTRISNYLNYVTFVGENRSSDVAPRGISTTYKNTVRFVNAAKVFVYSRAMSVEEIREKMRLIKELEL